MILIMCPQSRSGRGRRLWQYWQERLTYAGLEYRCLETQYPGHAVELTAEAKDEIIVAVGGDGTINEVINGIMLSERKKTLGVLYSGTSPDFCRFHNISTDPQVAMDSLLGGKSAKIDVVRIGYKKDEIEKAGFFSCSCNVGLGAAVASFANRNRRYLGDALGTGLGVVRAIAGSRHFDLQMKIDGSELELPGCRHVMLVKNPHIASGLKLDLDLKSGDGRAYVAAFCGSRGDLLRQLPGMYTGKLTQSDIFLREFRQIEINSGSNVEIEFDGDPQGWLPVMAEVAQASLLVINNAAKEED